MDDEQIAKAKDDLIRLKLQLLESGPQGVLAVHEAEKAIAAWLEGKAQAA